MGAKFLVSAWIRTLFPPICRSCGDSFREGLSNILCASCFEAIRPYNLPTCSHCGEGLPERAFEEASITRCRDCGEGEYTIDQTLAFGPYEGPLRLAHHAFKFEGMEHLADVLGAKMAELASGFGPVDALVPVPVRPERERERGYHPTRLLAQEVSRRTGVPIRELICKAKPTPAQVSLTETERLKNLQGAFEVTEKLNPSSRLVLVDDVFTTGGTLEECAATLKSCGIPWVGALVLGRTPRVGR